MAEERGNHQWGDGGQLYHAGHDVRRQRHTFQIVVSNSTGSITSNAATLTVNPAAVAPTISAQPANQTVPAGQTATFAVAASGTAPLSYQWQKNGANISGATAASYTTPATTSTDNGSTFQVLVSNTAGSITSSAATLTVNPAAVAPRITTQPASQTVTAGQTATFAVVASGTAPLSYQWQKNGANIAGATSASYTTPATTSTDNGSTFQVVVSNTAGSITSNAATLTVNPAAVAPTITAQPANQTVTAGQTATFAVAASGTAPLSYQWQKNGANIAGATSASYTTPATTSTRQRLHVPGGGEQHSGERNEQCGDADGEPRGGGAHDHGATRESDGDGGPDGHLRGGGEWHSAAELPVAEERRKHHAEPRRPAIPRPLPRLPITAPRSRWW